MNINKIPMKLFHIFWETTIHVHFDNSTDLNVPDLVRVAYTYIYMYNRKLFQELYTRVHDIGIILFSKTRRTRKIDTYRACACARVRANTYDVYLSLSAVSRHIRNVTTRHLSRRDTRYVWRLFFLFFSSHSHCSTYWAHIPQKLIERSIEHLPLP